MRHWSRVISEQRGLHLTGLPPPRAVRCRAIEARRVPARQQRRGRYCPGPAAGDDVSVAHRVVADCEFEYSVEHHPATPGVASVEAEHELVQVAGQMRVIDRALVGSQKPSLGQRGEAGSSSPGSFPRARAAR